MIRRCCSIWVPFVCHMVKYCLEMSVFPVEWFQLKIALVTPISKTSDVSDPKDLRIITVVKTCLRQHL